MKPEQFEQCSLRRKLSLLNQQGTPLVVQHCNQYQIYLYNLDKMIVKVWYAKGLLQKRVVKIEVGLASGQLLEPYLEMIQLNLNE